MSETDSNLPPAAKVQADNRFYREPAPDPYLTKIGGQIADPYRIARAYGITDPVLFQALKKLLRAGRKHKSQRQDIREVITTCERWEAMNAEDDAE